MKNTISLLFWFCAGTTIVLVLFFGKLVSRIETTYREKGQLIYEKISYDLREDKIFISYGNNEYHGYLDLDSNLLEVLNESYLEVFYFENDPKSPMVKGIDEEPSYFHRKLVLVWAIVIGIPLVISSVILVRRLLTSAFKQNLSL